MVCEESCKAIRALLVCRKVGYEEELVKAELVDGDMKGDEL